jgi:hypothetical protein
MHFFGIYTGYLLSSSCDLSTPPLVSELLDNAMAHQQPVRLEIIIAGAGIIGFAASAALSRVRHRITVNKSCRSQEQGLVETQSL